MYKTLKPITYYVINHLKVRISEHLKQEPLLSETLETMDYNIENIRYYIKNDIIYLYMTNNNLPDFYARAFQIKMIMESHRYPFKDYSFEVMLLLSGAIDINFTIMHNIYKEWGGSITHLVQDALEKFQSNPSNSKFNWQIVGEEKFSVEILNSGVNFTLHLAVLDYIAQYVEHLEEKNET